MPIPLDARDLYLITCRLEASFCLRGSGKEVSVAERVIRSGQVRIEAARSFAEIDHVTVVLFITTFGQHDQTGGCAERRLADGQTVLWRNDGIVAEIGTRRNHGLHRFTRLCRVTVGWTVENLYVLDARPHDK